jgi:hypothetical protein
VPTRVLRPHPAGACFGDAASSNLQIQGDDLDAQKALLPLNRGWLVSQSTCWSSYVAMIDMNTVTVSRISRSSFRSKFAAGCGFSRAPS